VFRQDSGGNPIQFSGRDPGTQIPLERIERQADDLPDTADEFTPPPELLIEQPNPARGTAAIRRSSATIVPEASFDEPTRPSEHPSSDLNDEFPWFETTASSTPPPTR